MREIVRKVMGHGGVALVLEADLPTTLWKDLFGGMLYPFQ